jgi:probable phosphoglycerate mutase
MHIYLVRHGEVAARWHESDDPGLSERGRQQAADTAQLLLDRIEPGTRLVSSPLLRTRETAQALADVLAADGPGVGVQVVEAFREIPAPVTRADRQTWLGTIARQTWAEQHTSVRDWRAALLAELRGIREPTVVFTHFMVLNAIVGELRADERVVCCLPDTASVTTLRGFGDQLQLAELGRQLRTHVN